MVCGVNDTFCQISTWVTQNSELVRDALNTFVGSIDALFGSTSAFRKFLSDYGEKLIAALSLAFAVWRWWVFREAILHKRLDEYITESDKRLEPSSRAVVQALLRPGRTATLPQPSFARELRRVLVRHRWREQISAYRHVSFESRVQLKLGSSLRGVRRRIATARKAVTSLEAQQAQIHMIAGAISAAKARKGTVPAVIREHDAKALREFQQVLRIPGHHRSPEAKENEAFQLLRLGHRDLAFRAHEELEEYATTIADRRTRDLAISRAKRYRAQIYQSEAGGAGCMNADTLMRTSNGALGALRLREPYQPFEGWEAVEQAEMHYVAAWIASKLGWVNVEAQELQYSQQTYELLLHQLPQRTWLVGQNLRILRAEAAIGRQRILMAVAERKYDEDWLKV